MLAAGLGGLINSSSDRKKDHEHTNDSALEPADTLTSTNFTPDTSAATRSSVSTSPISRLFTGSGSASMPPFTRRFCHRGPAAGWLIIVALAVTYLALVAINAPYHVSLATAVFLAFFVASVLALPRLPSWWILAFLALVPVFYKLQAWSHKIWTVAADMTEFNKRFPPGRTLSTILLIYEVPICLNYLIFRRQDWRAEGFDQPSRLVTHARLATQGNHDVVRIRDREDETVEQPALRLRRPCASRCDSISGVSQPPR